MNRTRAFRLAAGLLALACCALAAPPAEAQTNFTVYRAKFTCGFAAGNVPDSGSNAAVLPVPYREVQPGNYSTVINLLNARMTGQTARVEVSILTEGRATAFLPDFTMETFSATSHVRIDCADIATALAAVGFQNDGRFVEGFAMILARDTNQNVGSELEVSAVYTYASRRSDAGGTGLGSSIDVERIEGKAEVQPE